MSTYVVVKQSGIVVVDGVDETVREGESFESDHPAVRKYPDLFGPITVRFPVARSSQVEKATAAPGERRVR